MSNRIVPQHPLAFLEFYFDDGWFMYASAHDADLLKPLYKLPYKIRDEEKSNQKMNAQLRRIQDILRKEVPGVSAEAANEVQWSVWRSLFYNKDEAVDDVKLHGAVIQEYQHQLAHEIKYKTTFWDPYLQI